MLKDNPTIILSRTDRMGDLILSFPSIRRLRQMYPKCRLILLIKQYTFELVRYNPYIDEIIQIDLLDEESVIRKIQQEKPDVFIALFSNAYVAKLARMSKAKIKIGPLSKLHSFFSYPQGIIQKRSHAKQNEAMYNLDLIRKLNPIAFDQFRDLNTELFFPEQFRNNARAYFVKEHMPATAKVIMLHPLTGGSAKNLSLKQYAGLVKLLLEQDEHIHIIISAIYQDADLIKKYFDFHTERLHPFINDSSILNMAAVLEHTDLYIGASTGPTHVAGCMQRKIIAVYPKILNQSPIRWGIINDPNVQYIQPEVHCSRKFGCIRSCTAYDCFSSIDVQSMAQQCLQLLGQE